MPKSDPLHPILVTGAASGIGRATTEMMAGLGYPVFAGARKSADLEALGAIPNVTPLRLDVTDPAEVARAVETVRAAGGGLYALVNNAGVGGVGPVASFTDDELREMFEINVFGVFRMTREFLPLLLEIRGRIVVVGSMAGSIAMNYYAPYAMTKHAVEAFVTALDREVRPHGVRVAIVQPGAIRTGINAAAQRGDQERFGRAPAPFDAEAGEIRNQLDVEAPFDPTQPESATNRISAPPSSVAQVIREVIESSDPSLRSLVGTRWEGNRVIDALMERIAQANALGTLGYSEAELVEKLRGALAAARR